MLFCFYLRKCLHYILCNLCVVLCCFALCLYGFLGCPLPGHAAEVLMGLCSGSCWQLSGVGLPGTACSSRGHGAWLSLLLPGSFSWALAAWVWEDDMPLLLVRLVSEPGGSWGEGRPECQLSCLSAALCRTWEALTAVAWNEHLVEFVQLCGARVL